MTTPPPNNSDDLHDQHDRHDRHDQSGPHESGDPQDPLRIAAFIDGRMSADEHAAFEVHLADCVPCREAIRETRATLAEFDETLPFVPAEVYHAAKALVTPRPGRVRPGRFRPGLARAGLAWPFLRAGLAAAASIAVCIVGYQAGAASSVAGSADEIDLESELSFGLLDPADDSGMDYELFAIAIEPGALDEEGGR